LCTKLYVAYW